MPRYGAPIWLDRVADVSVDTGNHPGSVLPPPGCALPARPQDAPPPGSALISHYGACMGCGTDHPTGLRMQVVAGEGLTVAGRFTVTEDHQGAPGLAHGGLVALAMDEVLGGLGWLLRRPMVTGRLHVEFVRPVRVGESLALSARVDGVDGRRIFCSGLAREGTDEGPVAARAFAVFVAVPLEHFRRHGRAADVDAAARAASAFGPGAQWDVAP